MKELRALSTFLMPYIRPYRRRLGAGIFFGILFGLFSGLMLGAVQFLIRRLTPGGSADLLTPSGTGLHHVGTLCLQAINPWLPQMGVPLDWRRILGGLLILPFLAAARGALSYLSSYCISWAGEKVTNDLRIAVVDRLTSLSIRYFDQAKMGDLLTRVQGDTSAIQMGLDRGISDSIKEPFTILGVAAFMIWTDWRLTVVAFLVLPLCIVPIRILGRKVRRASQAGIGQTILQSSLLVESLNGIRIIKAFCLEKIQLARFIGHSNRLAQMNIKRVQARQLVNPLIEVVLMLGMGGLMLYILSSHTRLEVIPPFLVGLILFQNSFKKLAQIHVIYKETGVALGRLSEVLNLEPSVPETQTPRPLPPFHEALDLRNVRFSYGEGDIVQGVDLRIERGIKMGIAGESGSGKSTLLNLFLRFYDPTSGAILFDGIDLREVTLADLRAQIALVSQEVVLFDMTVADNIGLGRIGATREEIIEAARAAYAHEFIESLPLGYDTLVGERGLRLSGGQRARLAIARAFVRNAPILILDEPTAALDAEAEKEVQKALDRLTEHRTVICVAHRLATLQAMDQVVVMSAGKIAERGTFAELIARNGIFSRMAAQQGIRA